MAELIWMIVEFVKIGKNDKLDGNGCLLDDDTTNLIQGIAIEGIQLGA